MFFCWLPSPHGYCRDPFMVAGHSDFHIHHFLFTPSDLDLLRTNREWIHLQVRSLLQRSEMKHVLGIDFFWGFFEV